MKNNPCTRPYLVLLALGCGCGGGVPPWTDPPPIDTETDGIFTSGIDGNGGEDGADETAEPPAPAYCITNSENPEDHEGVKHQCDVEYDLTISFALDRPFGLSDWLESHTVTVVSLNESTYEHPLVAVCCTDITDYPDWPLEDTCATPHHKACMVDLIEHICHAPQSWLFTMSLDNIFNGEGLIQEAAEDFAENEFNLRDECINHFLFGPPDDLNEANLCDPEFAGNFDHTAWEPGITWSNVITGYSLINLKVELSSSVDGPEVPPSPADSCILPPDNNGEVPPFSLPGVGGGFVTPVDPVTVSVIGPEYEEEAIEGLGYLSEDSRIHREITLTNKLIIDRWVMTEEAAATVGTTSASVTLDNFKLELVGEQQAVLSSSVWTFPTGSAVFSLAASTGGIGYSVAAINTTDIVFNTISGGVGDCPGNVNTSCLVSSSFDIEYMDATAGYWTLTVQGATWQPP